MKLFLAIIFSLLSSHLRAASCCVANTSISNLMVLPSKWQQSFSMVHTNAIGDSGPSGTSTFRNDKNKEQTNTAKMDLSYAWNADYQSGISLKYQNKSRSFNGSSANDSGWSDLGLSHAYKLSSLNRSWIFQTINIPTASSIYDSQESFAVDAQGSGTYQTSVGLFILQNTKEWDFTLSPEVHYSFSKTFEDQGTETQLDEFWGGSLSLGSGYIPWRSKFRLGLNLTPRLEGPKTTRRNDTKLAGKESLVWDSVANVTYTINAEYSIGASYIDQTLVGPARNTVLNRTFAVIFQTRWL